MQLRNIGIGSLVVRGDSEPNAELMIDLYTNGYRPSLTGYIEVTYHKAGFYNVIRGGEIVNAMIDLNANEYHNGNPPLFARIDAMLVA